MCIEMRTVYPENCRPIVCKYETRQRNYDELSVRRFDQGGDLADNGLSTWRKPGKLYNTNTI